MIALATRECRVELAQPGERLALVALKIFWATYLDLAMCLAADVAEPVVHQHSVEPTCGTTWRSLWKKQLME
jgi:hypothetical protein